MENSTDLHREIARLALVVHGGTTRAPEPEQVLSMVTASAVTLIPGVDHASVTVVRRSRLGAPEVVSLAATGDVARRFDLLQRVHDSGPFRAAVRDRDVVVDDMRTDTRWPDLTAAVVRDTPIRSTLSMQLNAGDLESGALTFHSETPRTFDDHGTRDSSLILARHTAIALDNAFRESQFRSALASRDTIGQATGMIMERYDVDAASATDLLRTLSRNSNRPLDHVAAELVAQDRPPQR